ncbi:hypothetical protein SUGI_0337060 [Cryptomeria japonica]|nr:hypothetical protein SUGI_0337060 [Cryptomeria japonica]
MEIEESLLQWHCGHQSSLRHGAAVSSGGSDAATLHHQNVVISNLLEIFVPIRVSSFQCPSLAMTQQIFKII